MTHQIRFDPAQPRDETGKWTDTGKSSTGRYSYNDLYQIVDSATGKLTHSLGSKRNADMVLKDLEHGADIPENLIKKDYSGVDIKIKWYGRDNILENAQMVIDSNGRKFYTGWVIGDDGRRFSFYEPAQNVIALTPVSSMRAIQRTIAQVIRTYRDQLTNATYDTLNGRTDAVGMGRAHRDMIWRLGPDAYMEGLREGGVPAEELDSADRKAITDWLNSQMAHVSKFASDTVAARGDDGKRKQILSRLDMWVESMRTIGSQGLMSAKKNKMGVWRLGPTEKHCITKNGRIGCANLHGKRHRLSWFLSRGLIPRQPGSAILGCQGYQCLCEIRGDDGTVLVPATGRALRFDPNQPRDEQGQWTNTGKSNSNHTEKMSKAVSDYLGMHPKFISFEILSEEDFDNRFVTLEDKYSGHLAGAIITNDNKIYIRKGSEDLALHELVHAAGAEEKGIGRYLSEGITQSAAESIGKQSGITVRKTYDDETGFVRKYILPTIGIPEKQFYSGYMKTGDKGKYIADLIWSRHGDKFSESDWGKNAKNNFAKSLAYTIGTDLYLSYLVDELGVK